MAVGSQFTAERSEEPDEWRTEAARRLLFSALNHMAAAQASVEGDDPVSPSGLNPFPRLLAAIHAGTAAEHLLKALIISAPGDERGSTQRGNPETVRELRKLVFHGLLTQAKLAFPDVDLHEAAIKEVNNKRNHAVHEGRGPDNATTVRIVRATEELAAYVTKELRVACSPVLGVLREFDEFRESVAVSRAIDAWASDVDARVKFAADSYAARFGERDAVEVSALLELDRDEWVTAAGPGARHVDRECPACRSSGFVILTVDHMVVGTDSVEHARADRFFCVACRLELEHSDWPFAGITDTYSDPDPELFDW